MIIGPDLIWRGFGGPVGDAAGVQVGQQLVPPGVDGAAQAVHSAISVAAQKVSQRCFFSNRSASRDPAFRSQKTSVTSGSTS